MDVAVVEGVVGLGARRDAARLAGRRQREDVVVRQVCVRSSSMRRVVVAERRPQHGLPQHGRVHVEHRRLVFGIGAVVVGVVAEHQPESV